MNLGSSLNLVPQQPVYAGLRRSQTALRSVSLNAIAEKEEVGEGKLKNTTGGNFIMFSYNDFLLYNLGSSLNLVPQQHLRQCFHHS